MKLSVEYIHGFYWIVIDGQKYTGRHWLSEIIALKSDVYEHFEKLLKQG